jgi:uncharacterized protein (TIGR00297 family)
MTPLENLAVVLALCATLSFISHRFHLLTVSGSAASFAMGVIIGLFGSIEWLLLLIIFAVMGFVVTRFRFEIKARAGVQEGKRGERTYRNVLANALVPAMVAVVAWAIGQQGSAIPAIVYLTSISVAASDTIASELGVLSQNARLITTMRPVPAGTDGGVSAFGTAWALIAAGLASLVGWLIILPAAPIDARILVPVVFGFAGCNIDSLIGATLEQRGLVNKLGTNILSMAAGAALGLAVLSA